LAVALRPAIEPRRSQGSGQLGVGPIWTTLTVLVVAAAGWVLWSAVTASGTSASASSPADPVTALQQDLLKKNMGQRGDAVLDALYQQINTEHFGGALSAIPVRWEPGLADAGKLAAQAFTLEGLFGHLGSRSVILLNPDMQSDPRAIARALSHEMVHAYLFSTGDVNENHGPAFQAVLKRLSDEGAFEGTPATDTDRTSLRAWLDEESARLDAERDVMAQEGTEIEREKAEIERALADVDQRASSTQVPGRASDDEVAALTARRDAYNARATAANDRLERDRADLAHFNAEVTRYNLMLVYPDGLDQSAAVKPKVATPATQAAERR
jgi:hypothetical protein